MKRLFLFFGILCSVFCAFSQQGMAQKPFTVVIDAGHGGKDPGASGRHSREKDIALMVALKTGAYLEEHCPDIHVVYTRKKDLFVELDKRAAIANDIKADLFLSIHCNSNGSSRPYGSETYVMGLHKSAANLAVAKKENASILLEHDYNARYAGFDPNSDEGYIALTMFQNAYHDFSIRVASRIQDQFRVRVGRKDRGVRQAGFLVLHQTAMPGVLVELGFLSNPTEEQFLRSEKGQVYMASALYRAVKAYRNEVQKINGETVNLQSQEPETFVDQEQQLQSDAPKAKQVMYRVQFLSLPEKTKLSHARFNGLDGVKYYQYKGMYRYTVGNTPELKEAEKIQKKMRRKGFKDAFVVAFNQEERISLQAARQLNAN